MEAILDTMKKNTRVGDLSAEELKAVRRDLRTKIVDMFEMLMNEPRYYGVRWCGTLTDLAELTHIAWASGDFHDSCGRPLSFRCMLDHVCDVLGCKRISNPYSIASRAAQRKNVKAMSVIDRYVKLTVEYRLKNPMTLDMRRTRGSISPPSQR